MRSMNEMEWDGTGAGQGRAGQGRVKWNGMDETGCMYGQVRIDACITVYLRN